ncbi:MAG: sulfatase-like hydrolase/transferase [Planctomycetota bacterium]
MLACLLAALLAGADRSPPNVVLIISDDQGWTDYGFMGHPRVKTPHLDKLAAESRLFTRGYVTSSLCCPSLSAILTGRYPHQTRITGNEPPTPAGIAKGTRYRDPGFLAQVRRLNGFLQEQPRIPALLAAKGYRSFQAGKWWGGSFATGGFTDGMSQGDPLRGGRRGDEGLEIGRKTLEPVTRFMDKCQADGAPFFVWYAPMLPHTPHNPPPRFMDPQREGASSLPQARYLAMCGWFDETCGQLLRHLDDKGLRENTIVVYVTDNGWIQDPAGPGYRSDSKQSQYDGGLRTPIMVRWPGKVKAARIEKPVSSIDIAPTILRAVGIPAPDLLAGIDLLDDGKVSSRGPVMGACFLHDAVDVEKPSASWTYRWMVDGDYKRILPNDKIVTKANKPGRGLGPELYKITIDPFEETNLSAMEINRASRMDAVLADWWTP